MANLIKCGRCGAVNLTAREQEFYNWLRIHFPRKIPRQSLMAERLRLPKQRIFQLVERLSEKGYLQKRTRGTVTYFEDGRSNGRKGKS